MNQEYKLYDVLITTNVVVRAKTEEEAIKFAKSEFRSDNGEPLEIEVEIISHIDQLKGGWDKWSLPYGERHPMDWEIGRQLEEK